MPIGWISRWTPPLSQIPPCTRILEIAIVYIRYMKETIARSCARIFKMFVFSPENSCTENEPLSSLLMSQYFYSRGWLNKILVCDPFCFTLFFFCFPALSFWWILTVPKGKYILVAPFPSAVDIFLLYFHPSWILSFVSFISGFPTPHPTTTVYYKDREGKTCLYYGVLSLPRPSPNMPFSLLLVSSLFLWSRQPRHFMKKLWSAFIPEIRVLSNPEMNWCSVKF